MIYLFDENAGYDTLTLKGENHKYLIKVRRHKIGDEIAFRNKKDTKKLYLYRIDELDGRCLKLSLLSTSIREIKATKKLHIAWCAIDSKSIEKVLPTLNEMGVSRISFIYCERSQKNFKLDFKRYERILESSMQQSGRTDMMNLDRYKDIKSFIVEFPDTKVFDFTDKILMGDSNFERVLVGCEGGFSKEEKEFLKTQEIFRLDSPMVLRSESAVMAVAAKILI